MADMYQPKTAQDAGVFSKKIGFTSVQIFKDQILGRGAYGSVCKAKCDELICAAKILHPTLFDPLTLVQIAPQREHRSPISRFERECAYMNAIRHPNIVQYLGVFEDQDTKLPVILMEFMKESLTGFLKNSSQPIPYHIQVNICHDVILALTYLHSNKIIHRDLSSNNVLLLGNLQAKVTDFGMARLGEQNSHSPQLSFTACPGTQVYMPPEALETHPVYFEKMDCFSFGVLAIQILTRQFPKPGEALKTVDESLAGLPRGEVMLRVSEIDRRRNHISMVEKDHPLLPISLGCLKDKDVKRPKAKEVCQIISDLKEKSKYKESVKIEENRNMLELERKKSELHTLKLQHAQQIEELQDTIRSQEIRLEEINKHMDQQELIIHEKEEVIEQQSNIIDQKEQLLSKSNEESEKAKLALQEEVVALKRRLEQQLQATAQLEQGTKDQEQSDLDPKLKAQLADLNRKVAVSRKVITQKEAIIRRVEDKIASKEMEIYTLTDKLKRMNIELEKEVQTTKEREKQMKQNEEIMTKFTERINLLEQQLKQSTQPSSLHHQTAQPAPAPMQQQRQFGNQQHNLYQRTAAIGTTASAGRTVAGSTKKTGLRLRWTRGNVAPKMMSRGPDPIVHENFVYFVPSTDAGSAPIMCYSVANKSWLEISGYPYCTRNFSLAFLNNQLTGIGGSGDNGYTNKLFSLRVESGVRRWMEEFPSMPTMRSNTSVVVSGVHLIVIGGRNENGSLTVTEVMNVETRQWFSSIPLPEPTMGSSITICGDRVYLLGGEVGRFFNSTQSVYTCSLSSLLQCGRLNSTIVTVPHIAYQTPAPRTASGDEEWNKIANLPVFRSTCISFRGQILAFGGEDSEKKSTTAVHAYDQRTNSWSLTDHLITARTGCFVALLPTNQLMVVGGWTKRALLLFTVKTNDIEFGTPVE